ncbi:hypothetical protein GDO81_027869 [Engystomops pustulosus]|uniref:Uncharacterized protein n=1 Tax=Engystomops pustulosus TaxID=76066 RepID=A0AAV6YNZ3_ENGPU|nr:hypothetical protein GDO81_027869 [Engystomops pustulosus]
MTPPPCTIIAPKNQVCDLSLPQHVSAMQTVRPAGAVHLRAPPPQKLKYLVSAVILPGQSTIISQAQGARPPKNRTHNQSEHKGRGLSPAPPLSPEQSSINQRTRRLPLPMQHYTGDPIVTQLSPTPSARLSGGRFRKTEDDLGGRGLSDTQLSQIPECPLIPPIRSPGKLCVCIYNGGGVYHYHSHVITSSAAPPPPAATMGGRGEPPFCQRRHRSGGVILFARRFAVCLDLCFGGCVRRAIHRYKYL